MSVCNGLTPGSQKIGLLGCFLKYRKCEGISGAAEGGEWQHLLEWTSVLRVIQGYCIYKLSDGLPVVQCHHAGSKPLILFFIHPSMISLTPVVGFSICIGLGIVDWNITSDTTLRKRKDNFFSPV